MWTIFTGTFRKKSRKCSHGVRCNCTSTTPVTKYFCYIYIVTLQGVPLGGIGGGVSDIP